MKTRIIKRYPNRKLYDTLTKKYVSLDDVAFLIRNNEQVQVMDNESGLEITNQILTQIIFEEGKKGNSAIPAEVLHDMIRWGNTVIDRGVDQVMKGVDKLVQDSLSKWIPRSNKEEIAQLEQKVQTLEHLIEQLSVDVENKN
ncbi:hypothetical protein EP331_09765 [bacterium]|nr:MAG: hypothetical protein EP331_09765 [bacterium]